MSMTGEIHLCNRADNDLQRHFDGRVAHLMIFNATLTADQINAIWTEVRARDQK